jgi:hypothetical protein
MMRTDLADYAQHILHLLHSLFPTIFGDESRVSKSYNFPQVCNKLCDV